MKTLRLSLKLYSTFHTDLLILKECDIAFSSLVKLALYYRVRGRKLNIFIPKCKEYRYRYKRAFTKSVITIDDDATIRFLTTMIREKRRMAFVRSVLYDALISPPCGGFFKDCRLLELESDRLGSIDLSGYCDLIICRPGTGKAKRKPEILRPTADIPEWVPRDWSDDPSQGPLAEDPVTIASEKADVKNPPQSTDLEDPDGRNDLSRRKKRRKRKKKRPVAEPLSETQQDYAAPAAVQTAGLLVTRIEAGDTDVLPSSPSPSDQKTDKELFPMLEEEEF